MNSIFNQSQALEAAKYAGDVGLRCENINDRLRRQLANHAEQTAKIERALTLLERNPELQELLNLAREVGL